MGFTASASTRPLSSITERRTGSGDEEESEEEEEDGEGDDWIQDQGTNYQRHKIRPASDCVIKSGYLWKKGERRHVSTGIIITFLVAYKLFSCEGMEETLVCATTGSARALQVVEGVQSSATA